MVVDVGLVEIVIVALFAILGVGGGVAWERRRSTDSKRTDETASAPSEEPALEPPADVDEGVDLATAPHEYRPGDEGPADRVLLTIATSKALASRTGAAPAESVARQFHRALEAADLPHRIEVHAALEPVPPAEGTVGSGAPGWWRREGERITRDADEAAGDANLLLVDQVGGGGTYGTWNVVGAGGCTIDLPAAASRSGPEGDSLSAALHEIGHTFGLPHDLDPDVPGDQHTGEGWNGDGAWHRTPMTVDHGVTNACGTAVPEREHNDVVQHLEFTDCTVESWNPFRHRNEQ